AAAPLRSRWLSRRYTTGRGKKGTWSARRCQGFCELRVVEVVVEAAPEQQLLVTALFDDAAVVHHYDRVGIADGRQAVGDDEAGPPASQSCHRLLDEHLRACVHVAGGLVEDENAAVGEEGAGDGQELPLAGRDVRSLLVEDRVVAVR